MAKHQQSVSPGVGAQLRDRKVQLAAGALEQKFGQMRREVVGKARRPWRACGELNKKSYMMNPKEVIYKMLFVLGIPLEALNRHSVFECIGQFSSFSDGVTRKATPPGSAAHATAHERAG